MNRIIKIFLLAFLICTLIALPNYQLYAQLVPDFRVNDDSTNFAQYYAKVGTDEQGNFVVVWYDQGDIKIKAQLFDSSAHRLGNNFQINNDNFSTVPSLAVRKDGSFAVCWSVFETKLRIFDKFGNPIISEIILSDSAGRITSIGSDGEGNFVTCWEQYNQSIHTDVYCQRIDSSGNKIGSMIKVNDHNLNINHETPSIAVKPDGSFIITWNDTRPPAVPNKDDIYFQMFDPNGIKIGMNQKVNDDPGPDNLQHSPKVSVDSSGQFVIAWNDDRHSHSNNEVYAQRFSSNGNYIGQNFRVTQSSLSITKGLSSIDKKPSGDFIVYWTEFLNPSGVPYFQRFRNDGSFIGNNFRVTNQSLSTEKFSSDIKVFNDRIICIWSDERNGPLDVYCNIRSFTNPDTTVNVINNSSLNPDAFSLFQNYPNPFNSGTKINYEITLNGRYKMEVFNLLGQSVELLFDKFLKPGKYETVFLSDNLVSRLYFYSLSSDNERIIKKLLVLK